MSQSGITGSGNPGVLHRAVVTTACLSLVLQGPLGAYIGPTGLSLVLHRGLTRAVVTTACLSLVLQGLETLGSYIGLW